MINFKKLTLTPVKERKIFAEYINDEVYIRDKFRPNPAILKRSIDEEDWILDAGAAGLSEDEARLMFCRSYVVDIFINKELNNVID